MRTLPDIPSATLLKLLRSRAERLRDAGGRLMIAGVTPALAQRLGRAGIGEFLHEDDVYPATGTLFKALDDAYTEAKRWLAEQDGSTPAG